MTDRPAVDTFLNVQNLFPHKFELTAAFADTDAGGVVYHTRYLEFFERARFELFQALDPGAVIPSSDGGGYVVGDMNVHFRKPARLGERFRIETTVKEVKRVSFVLTQKALSAKSGDLYCEADVTIAKVGSDWKAALLSPRIQEGLKAGLSAV